MLISVEKIANENPNVIKLLNICNFLSLNNIPERILEALLRKKIKKMNKLDFQDALRILKSHSMILQKSSQK